MALSGKTVVFTGTLDMQRSKATAMATDAGAKVTSAISGNTDIVVAGAQAGSKLDQAKAKGIKIMKESEFVTACSGKKAPAAADKKPGAAAPSKGKAPRGSVVSPSTSAGEWQWLDADSGDWNDFAEADSKLLEGNFVGNKFSFTVTTELSFNKKHKTPYVFDLLKKIQKNSESGTMKKIRRLVDGVESYQRNSQAGVKGTTSRGKRGHDDDEEDEAPIVAKKKAPAPKKAGGGGGSSSALQGKTIVFTGTLSMKRAVATAKATDAGAKVTSAVSGKTDYLVCGENAGSKEDEAESLGAKIISEKKFLKLCSGEGGDDDDDDDDDDEEEDADEKKEKLMKQMRKHKLPAVEIDLVPMKKGEVCKPWSSRLGGFADWPAGKEDQYPVDEEGEKMVFLGQINTEELPAGHLPAKAFPKEGVLQFFQSVNYDYDRLKKAVYYHETVPTRSSLVKDGIPSSDELSFSGQCKLKFSKIDDVLPCRDYRFEKLIGADPYDEKYEDIIDDIQDEDEFSGNGHKIGGFQDFVQEDIRDGGDYDAEDGSQEICLLQLDSNGVKASATTEAFDMCWGDCGIAHFFIREKDLLLKKFDEAYFTFDCG